MNESYHVNERVMSMSHVSHVQVSQPTRNTVGRGKDIIKITHIDESTHMNESCHVNKRVMSMSHVSHKWMDQTTRNSADSKEDTMKITHTDVFTHMNELCRTHECASLWVTLDAYKQVNLRAILQAARRTSSNVSRGDIRMSAGYTPQYMASRLSARARVCMYVCVWKKE